MVNGSMSSETCAYTVQRDFVYFRSAENVRNDPVCVCEGKETDGHVFIH